MNDYIVVLKMSAECPDDAEELIQDYTGQETSVEVLTIGQPNKYPRGD